MKPHLYHVFLMFFGALVGGTGAMATTFPSATTPFSKYGQIQNVQNYSSNPFWSPDAPYNQRMPVPVYAQGTDVDTTDCQTVVSALVASFCSTRNNCNGMDVNDVRPTITVQLASLPNHNYVTPCAGYIDTEFKKYTSANSYLTPGTGSTAFPTATGPMYNNQNTTTGNGAANYNPQQKLPTWNGEPWMQDMLQRKQELQNLQSATTNTTNLARAEFPETALDLTFTQRLQNDAAGYAPYKDASAYTTINLDAVVAEQNELYKQRQNAYCTQAPKIIAVLDSDIAILQKCKSENTPFSTCVTKLQGRY